MSGLNSISISSVNCNSLNMASAVSTIQKRKVYGICKLKTEIIFISDIRLGNRNLTSSLGNVAKIFKMNPYGSYDLIHNSTKNKRGVGILINSEVDFTELQRVADPEENFLLIKANIYGKTYILGSIYGPNEHDPGFFISLFRGISSLGEHEIILGGDFNCTICCDNDADNLDCFNMTSPPILDSLIISGNFAPTLA